MAVDPKELRDIELRTMQREMAGGLAAPKPGELVDLRTLLTALDEARADEREKVLAEVAALASNLRSSSHYLQQTGDEFGKGLIAAVGHLEALVARLRAEAKP